jgi:hypothetical protein
MNFPLQENPCQDRLRSISIDSRPTLTLDSSQHMMGDVKQLRHLQLLFSAPFYLLKFSCVPAQIAAPDAKRSKYMLGKCKEKMRSMVSCSPGITPFPHRRLATTHQQRPETPV